MLFGWLALLILFIIPRSYQQPAPDPTIVEVVSVPQVPVVQKELPLSDWYYIDKEKNVCGPFFARILHEKWLEGTLSTASWVWHESMSGWKQISQEPLLLEWLQKK